jgi:hypothetical protein
MSKNPYILRCYARPEQDHFIGVCVDLDIVVQGDSLQGIQDEMTKAIKAYFSSLDVKNFKDVFPRTVPWLVMLDYYKVCFIVRALNFKHSFKIFFEQIIPKEFLVSPCV